MWRDKAADFLIRYLLRERRKVCAYVGAYPLIVVNPSWQPHITIAYQNTPIQGFYYHFIEFKNEGNRTVQQLPFTVTLSLTAIIAWPIQFPLGCFQNLLNPTLNEIRGEINFINPREKVTLGFWAFNDTAGTSTISARAPEVEFQNKPWKSETDKAFKVGVAIHQVIFWIGAAIVLIGILYGTYRGARFVYRHASERVAKILEHVP